MNGGTHRVPILCLSTQDFTDLWTRKQRFMTNFAREGHKVIYVETQWHLLTWVKQLWGDFGRINFGRILRFMRKPREAEKNLYIATPPLLLPFFQMFTPIAVVNNLVVGLWLRWICARLGVRQPLVYTYVPYSHLSIKIIGSKKVLYEKVDDLAAAQGLVKKSTVKTLEDKLLKITGTVIVTASRLKRMLMGSHDRIEIIPNACEVSHFRKAITSPVARAIDNIPRPRIGFVGAFAYWLDQDLIAYLADTYPKWQFVFIGPVATNVDKLKRYENVRFLGRVPYDELPSYMAGIDVFINPYKQDDVAASCSPLKVFEYLAAGSPVVSVPMPEVMRFSPDLRIADNYFEFGKSIKGLIELDQTELNQLRRRLTMLVENDDWSDRFQRTRDILQREFSK